MSAMEAPLLKYGRRNDFKVLENANQNPGPTGFFSFLAEGVLNEIAKEVIPSNIYRLHESGIIYIHKLPFSIYIPYCTGHNLASLLKKGLKTPTVISRPARHFDTFVDHVGNYLVTMQHYFTGAQALSSVEWYAGPFIRKDGVTYKQIKQHVQRLLFNLNYPTRIGLQTPFTNFTVSLNAPKKTLDSVKAFYGGEEVDCLGAYEEEAKSFFKALAELYLEGDSIGQPFTFPIPTLMASSRWIWDDPEIHDLVFKVASKRGSFYWLNTRVVDPDATYAMCCRLNIQIREFEHAYGNSKFTLSLKKDLEEVREEYWKIMERQKFGGLWAMPDSTGSVNVVDVNLPRLALEFKKEESRFWEAYDEVLASVRSSLIWFRTRYLELIRSFPDMYVMISEYLPQFPITHFNTIGLIGLPEAAAIMMQEPKLWLEGSEHDWLVATDLMKRIVEHSVNRAREWMREDQIPWNVEEVPGESAASKLAITDLRAHPELAEYLPAEPLYSTSVVPYYAEVELDTRVLLESRVQKYFTGGVMMHVFLGEEPDHEALSELTKKIMNTDIVYWSYTPAVTCCKKCKKSFTGLYNKCPSCGSEEIDVWSRIVGYYRPLRNWNPYRRKEFYHRHHYIL